MMNDREFSNRKETLHGEFYENALKYPERIALIYENEKVSYKMLRLYALRAANYMWQALEILFKQNRTEKMSMAQYQIYVSKLWSEICQKVGYMNIVDYDNFGDIKSIFYDLEKRHLIKKENDGIE